MTESGGLRIPVFAELPGWGRILLLATLGLSAVAVLASLAGIDPVVVFALAGLAILGLAWLVGTATERLGALTSPQVGAILNVTFGNIAELIIAFLALRAGLIDVVKASITGSIVGNLLLVLGAAVLVGGLRNGIQRFSQRTAGANAALLALAAIGLFIPAIFAISAGGGGEESQVLESEIVAVLLIAGYGLSLVYQFRHPESTLGGHDAAADHGGPAWSRGVAIGVLIAAAAILTVVSEVLVEGIEPVIESFGLTPFFVGVIVIPTIGNLAEHLVAVQLAWKDKMEFAMAVCYGSSLQVALFVAPILVLAGVVMGQPMDLVFLPLEVAAVAVAVGISALIALDGESNWLEGSLLVIVYLILAGSFFALR